MGMAATDTIATSLRKPAETFSQVIEDVDSLNGLIYRGRRVDRLILNHNDQIYIAPAVVVHYKAFAKTDKVESV